MKRTEQNISEEKNSVSKYTILHLLIPAKTMHWIWSNFETQSGFKHSATHFPDILLFIGRKRNLKMTKNPNIEPNNSPPLGLYLSFQYTSEERQFIRNPDWLSGRKCMVQFCFSLLPLTLVKGSELCKVPVRFFRYIILLFSFQALSDFKAEEAKVPSEVEAAVFFIIHWHTSNKDCTI